MWYRCSLFGRSYVRWCGVIGVFRRLLLYPPPHPPTGGGAGDDSRPGHMPPWGTTPPRLLETGATGHYSRPQDRPFAHAPTPRAEAPGVPWSQFATGQAPDTGNPRGFRSPNPRELLTRGDRTRPAPPAPTSGSHGSSGTRFHYHVRGIHRRVCSWWPTTRTGGTMWMVPADGLTIGGVDV